MDFLLAFAFIFVVAFLSNVSPFFGASYTLVATLQLSELGFSPFNFFLVVWASAMGATIAKVVIYYGAFGLRGVLVKNRNMQLIGRNKTKGRFYLVLFATALLPVHPLDDFSYIGAGANKASIGAMTAVTMTAKLTKSALEIALQFTILKVIKNAFGFSGLQVTVALAVAFLLLGIGIYKLDWEKWYNRMRKTLLPNVNH